MELRPYQVQAQDAAIQSLLIDKINPLFEAATGTGKSFMMASLINEMVSRYPNLQVISLAHSQELIEQNYESFKSLSDVDTGILCSGLKRKDTTQKVLFASVQSVANKLHLIGTRHLVIIDEAHLVPFKPTSQYQKVIAHLKKVYPTAKFVGYTATPHRHKEGLIVGHKTSLFDKIVFQYTIKNALDDGYLSPLVNSIPQQCIDESQIAIVDNEFCVSHSNKEVLKILNIIINDVVKMSHLRKSILFFVPQIESCEILSDLLTKYQLSNATIHSKTSKEDRKLNIERFKKGEIKALVSVACLTTGFNAENTDMIVCLRPTRSKTFFVQMMGRGTRLASLKENCLVVDYTGNLKRFGSIDKIQFKPKEPRTSKRITKMEKTCINKHCGASLHLSVRICPFCNTRQPLKQKLEEEFDANTPIISTNKINIRKQKLDVESMNAKLHTSRKNNKTFKLTFKCKNRIKDIVIYLSFDSKYYMIKNLAQNIWSELNGTSPYPVSSTEAAKRRLELKTPSYIEICKKGDFHRLLGAHYE